MIADGKYVASLFDADFCMTKAGSSAISFVWETDGGERLSYVLALTDSTGRPNHFAIQLTRRWATTWDGRDLTWFRENREKLIGTHAELTVRDGRIDWVTAEGKCEEREKLESRVGEREKLESRVGVGERRSLSSSVSAGRADVRSVSARDALTYNGASRAVEQKSNHLSPTPTQNSNFSSSHHSPTPTQNSNSTPSIADYFARLPTTWHHAQERMCARLEKDLGLPKEILMTLDWRWDAAAHAVAIPMRDAWGEVTGIRYRSLETGAKWAKRGSKDGLFFDPEFIPWDPEELVICEGPTDCAAAMACGFWAVGRSSCGTGRAALKELIKRKGVRRVTIVADDDKPKPKPGGGTWRPGLDGAKRLAEGIGSAYRIVLPPYGFKDLRDWYRAGTLNAASFKAMCQGTDWQGPGL